MSRLRLPAATLPRSLALVVFAGVVLYLASEGLSAYRDLQLASGAYYFIVLSGLTVLTGLSGQISLGNGAFMAIGAYTTALLLLHSSWPFIAVLVVAAVATAVVAPLVPPASYTHDGGDVRNNLNPTSRSHRPSGPVYVHHTGNYAIAPDGSTHSSGRACWKGFKLMGQGWTYLGSYDQDLTKVDRGGNSGGDQQLPH